MLLNVLPVELSIAKTDWNKTNKDNNIIICYFLLCIFFFSYLCIYYMFFINAIIYIRLKSDNRKKNQNANFIINFYSFIYK